MTDEGDLGRHCYDHYSECNFKMIVEISEREFLEASE